MKCRGGEPAVTLVKEGYKKTYGSPCFLCPLPGGIGERDEGYGAQDKEAMEG